ncbi:MAG: indole-3-glycerol phosphate synthase TrpC [Chloroflexota bacterium]|jgi:indole-3-glycerol phosphate synthase
MSVSQQSQRRGTILDEIMTYHREQLPKIKREVPVSDLRALASVSPPAISFKAALDLPGVSLIAECKKASPSKGLLARDYDPVRLAETYVRAGARAISVLTDGRHFQGSLAHLRDVKETVSQLKRLIADKRDPRLRTGVPVLRKDFIFDPYQLYEARAAGADAVLLIATVLQGGELAELLNRSQALGMEALIEVYAQEELERVLPLSPAIVGINNRNLQTFEVDFENTARLRAMIPAGVTVVSESGIKGAEDVRRLAQMGVDAILVGETLVRSKDVGATAAELAAAGL